LLYRLARLHSYRFVMWIRIHLCSLMWSRFILLTLMRIRILISDSHLRPLVFRPSWAPLWASTPPLWASTAPFLAAKAPEFWLQCGSGSSFSLWRESRSSFKKKNILIRICNLAWFASIIYWGKGPFVVTISSLQGLGAKSINQIGLVTNSRQNICLKILGINKWNQIEFPVLFLKNVRYYGIHYWKDVKVELESLLVRCVM
jgi:hypothetical protein